MSVKMKDLPLSERPYEKLEMYGAKSLSNSELLGIIIKTGSKNESSVELAKKVLKLAQGKQKDELRCLQEISIEEFCKIKGIGKVKAIQLIAVCEIAKRMSRPLDRINIKIKEPQDIANILMEEMRYEKREVAKVIILNSQNKILKMIDVSIGGTSYAVLEPKHILVDAIKMQAPKIILVHNHPSGDPTPSQNDYRATDRIYEAADIMGIELLDHLVIGDGKFESIFCHKKLKNK